MRKALVVVVAAIVTALAAPMGAAASRQTDGVTKTDIKVGVTYPDLDAIRNIVNLDHGDYQKAYTAVVDDLNKTGVSGRKVTLVFAPVNPIGTTPAEAACVKLTEDDKVFAVMGFFNSDAPLCYTERENTPVIGGSITSEYLRRAKAPWYSANAGDAAFGQVIDALAADGQFKKAKVGLVYAVGQKALTDQVILPALARNKVKPTTAVIDTAADDVVAAQQLSGTIAQRFKDEGIDSVVVVGNAFQVFASALEKTDYRPKLLATDRDVYLGYVGDKSHSPNVLKGAVSGGPARNFDEPTYVKCRAVVEKAIGTKLVDSSTQSTGVPQPEVSAYNACLNTALFAALAGAAGKNLTAASFEKAGAKLGAVELPGYGKVAYDPKLHAFALPIKLTRYDSARDKSVEDAEPVAVR
jgi:hypothetical protein